MNRRFTSWIFFIAVIGLSVAYARLALAVDAAAPRPVTRSLHAAALADGVTTSARLPVADRVHPARHGRRSALAAGKASPFVDVDLSAETRRPDPLRPGKAALDLAPAQPTLEALLAPTRAPADPSAPRPSNRDAPWTTDRLLADATHMNDAYVSLARSPASGDLYAVFEATDLGGTDRDIHIARSQDDGLNWIVWEMPSFSQDESMPEIAIDAAGFLHVVWVRHDGYIVRTRSAGADDPVNWSWIKGLFTDSVNATPTVAVTGAGDFATLYIAASYQEINYDLMSWEWTLIWMWSTNAGNTVNFDYFVPDGFPDLWPAAAMDGALVHLVNGEADIYGSPTKILMASDAASGGFTNVTDLTAWTAFNAGFPDVACDGDAVYAVYQHDWDDGVGNIDGDIVIYLSFDAGASLSGPYEIVADEFESVGPVVYADGGTVGCLWLDAPVGGDEFVVASRQAGGGGAPEAWPDVVEIVGDLALAEPQYHHLAGVVGDGRLHAAWIDRRDYPTQGHNVYTCERDLASDLLPYVPVGWDDALVASMTAGERTTGWLKADAPAYVSFGLANLGFVPTGADVEFELRVDGGIVGAWYVPGGLDASTYTTIEDHPLILGAGAHLLEVVLDPGGLVDGEDETNNTVAHQWVWVDGDPQLELAPDHVLHAVDAPLATRAASLAADAPTVRRRHLPAVSPELTAAVSTAELGTRNPEIPVIVVPALRLDVAAFDIRMAGATADLRRASVLAAGRNVTSLARTELAPTLDALTRGGHLHDLRELWLTGTFAARLTPAGVAALADDPAVGRLWLDDRPSRTFAQPSIAGSPDDVRKDDRALAWHLAAIGAPDVWAQGYDGEGVLIGHLDTGAAYDHPDLAGRLWDGGAAWPNHGWDALDEDDDPYEGDPTFGHGTHTAGLVVGDGDNGTTTGVAPGADLMVLRCVPGYWADLIEAMQFGLDEGPVDLFTMSAGWDAPAADLRASARANAEILLLAGIPWICAAGNGDNVGGHHPVPTDIASPSDCPHPWYGDAGHSAVISIGAIGIDDAVWSSSSIGPTSWDIAASGYDDYPYPPGLIKPDLAAPGSNVTSLTQAGGYVAYSGTSMACPVAAGAAALLLSASPGATPADLGRAFEVTAVDLGVAGRDVSTGAGRLDVAGALDEIPRLGRETVVVRNTGPLPLNLATVSWNAAWLQVAATAASIAPGDSTLLLLDFDAAGLPAGLHHDVVSLVSDDPNSPHTLTVTLAIGDVTGVDGPPAPAAVLTGVPNPFNPRTELRFEVPRRGRVALTLHDLRGRRVRTLVDGELAPGPHAAQWDGADDHGRALASGAYIARVRLPDGTASTAKLMLVR